MNKYSKEIEVKGHLIDSMILTKIFDNVMDLDGKFEVTKIKVESYQKEYLKKSFDIINNGN